MNIEENQAEYLQKDSKNAASPIHDHYNTNGHGIHTDNISIVGREDQNKDRSIKEAILIRHNDPFLNRNTGKYQLSHIWNEVLVNTPELQLK